MKTHEIRSSFRQDFRIGRDLQDAVNSDREISSMRFDSFCLLLLIVTLTSACTKSASTAELRKHKEQLVSPSFISKAEKRSPSMAAHSCLSTVSSNCHSRSLS